MLPLKTLFSLASFTASLSYVAALSNADIASVFDDTTNLQGSTVSLRMFDVTAITNSTHALFTLNATSTPSSRVGWMGIGTGDAMANADFMVVWPAQVGFDGTAPTNPWTLSHRNPTGGEAQPVLAGPADSATATEEFYTFLPHLSSNTTDSYTAVSWIRPLMMPANYPGKSPNINLARVATEFIYASSSVPPGNPAQNAVLTQHNQPHATTMLDLSKAITMGSTTPGTGSTGNGGNSTEGQGGNEAVPASSSSEARSSRDMMLIAHAIFGSLALLILVPSAILIARWLRGAKWFPSHAALNFVAALFIIIAFALGVDSKRGGHFNDSHTKVGLAIFIIILLQVGLGVSAHLLPSHRTNSTPSLATKHPLRLFHMTLGLALLALGYYQIHLGFTEWSTSSDAQTSVPMGVKVVFWLLLGLQVAGYLVGWALSATGKISNGVEGGKRTGSFDMAEKVPSVGH